jgi:hypothetical protein
MRRQNKGRIRGDPMIKDRWGLALVGAVGAGLLWAALDAVERGVIGPRLGEVLAALVATLTFAALALAGPIGLGRALVRALGLAVVTAALVWLGGLRFETGLAESDISLLAVSVVAALPLPFLITQAQGNWRDYPGLFLEAWSIVVRFATAWAFVGLVWLVLYLSDEVLKIAGVTLIGWLVEQPSVPMVLTGAVLGLGLAVLQDYAALMSPYLLLRLFRLLLPVVLAVMAVFLVALPFRGLDGLMADVSPAFLLLALVATGISLVAIAVDQSEEEAEASPFLRRATQAMALVLPILAALAVWALAQRVGQHGWTPERLFVALVAGLGLAYGLAYALAVLRGPGWQERIRRGNIHLALAALAVAALWLTPILNAEAIAARSQLARYDAGKTAVADLDIWALERWGKPGAAVLEDLRLRAEAPGQEALAARLDAARTGGPEVAAPDAQTLAALIPVQPPGATATRDILLAAAAPYLRNDWARYCAARTEGGDPACLMVVADLIPGRPGEEAILGLASAGGHHELIGLYLADDGTLATRAVSGLDGGYVGSEAAAALIAAWRKAPPPLTPAQLNQLGTGEGAVLFLP